MPTLEFKGKQHIYAHHLTVPFRTLEVDTGKSLNENYPPPSKIIHPTITLSSMVTTCTPLKRYSHATQTGLSASISTRPTTPATKDGSIMIT